PAESPRPARVQPSNTLPTITFAVEPLRCRPQPVFAEPSFARIVLAVTAYRSIPFSPLRSTLLRIVAPAALRTYKPPPRFVKFGSAGPTLMLRNGALPPSEAGST